MTVGTTTVKYANFLFQSPDWGLNSASPEPGNSRVDPLDTLAFHSMFPLRKAGGICIYRRNVGDKRSNFPLQPPEWGFAPCPRAPSTAEVLLKGEYCITCCKFSGTSKWNPGHARPHLTRGSPSPLMTILALRIPSKLACTHMRCKKRAGGKKEGRGEKILKKNP